MHCRFLALTMVALAGFATAVQADDGAAPRSTVMMLAKLDGKGFVGEACHAFEREKEIRNGIYDMHNAELVCRAPGGDEILCHPYDTLGPPVMPLCVDGWDN